MSAFIYQSDAMKLAGEVIAAAGSATTGWVDCFAENFADHCVYVDSNSGGGEELEVYMDFSSDGATTHGFAGPWYSRAGFGGGIGIPRIVRTTRRYARLRVENVSAGSVTVTAGHLAGSQMSQITMQRASSTYGDDYDAYNVRTISNFKSDIANGLAADQQSVNKFGANLAVGTTAEVIWATGGAYNFLTAASTLRIASGGNAADTAAGAGARSVVLVGLDENWMEVTETLATAGTSASLASSTTFIRLLRAYVADVGSYSTPVNTGDILIEDTAGSNTLATIAASGGQTQKLVYTVPANYNLEVHHIYGSVEGAKAATVEFYQRQNADDTSSPYTGRRIWHRAAGTFDLVYETPKLFPPKTDVWAEAKAVSGSTIVSGGFSGVLRRVRS